MKMIKGLVLLLLVFSVFVSACTVSNTKVLTVQEVKYIAKFHHDQEVTAAAANTWYSLPFNIYVENESTQGFVLSEDNKSIIVEGFSGIVKVNGCLHPFSTATGNQDATIYARVSVNGVEKRCLQASRTKAFRSGGVDILNFIGSIRVEPGDVIELQWKTDNPNIQLLKPDSVFDFPVSHTISLERIY